MHSCKGHSNNRLGNTPPIACILDYVSLWFVLQRGESRVAIRSCFDPQGIDSARVVTSGKNDCRFVVEGRTGRFAIHLQVLKEECEILHYKTELTPHRTVQMVVSARDLVFGGTGKNEEAEGKVHFTQKGPASAIAYASFRDSKESQGDPNCRPSNSFQEESNYSGFVCRRLLHALPDRVRDFAQIGERRHSSTPA